MSAEEREVRIISKDAVSNQLQELKELKKIEDEKQKLLGNTKNGKKSGKDTDKKNTDDNKLNKRLDELEKKQKQIESQISKVISITQNPEEFIKSQITDILKITGPAAIGVTVAELVFQRLEKEFGPGGSFDQTKAALDAVRELLPQDFLIAIDKGEVFFGDISLSQKAPQFSNTERLSNGRSKDIQRNIGY